MWWGWQSRELQLGLAQVKRSRWAISRYSERSVSSRGQASQMARAANSMKEPCGEPHFSYARSREQNLSCHTGVAARRMRVPTESGEPEICRIGFGST